MQVQKISFTGIEKKNDKKLVQVGVNGAGSGIGKNYGRQYILAKHGTPGVYTSWDKLSNVYAKQNLVMLNMGSMGLKDGKTNETVPNSSASSSLMHVLAVAITSIISETIWKISGSNEESSSI